MFIFFRRRRQRKPDDVAVPLGRVNEDRELMTARADSQRSLMLPNSNSANPDYINVTLPPYDVVPPGPESDQRRPSTGANDYSRIVLSSANSAANSSNSSGNNTSRSYITLPSAELARPQAAGGYGILRLDSDIAATTP